MIGVALKGLGGRKLRTALTMFAISLGVAMVSGTYVLTDTIDKAFNGIFQESYANTDVVVSGKTADISFEGETTEPPPIPEATLDKVGLSDRRHHRPAELSGGQQQRVAIGRALVSRPTVLFADEPTGNLDSQTSAEILRLLAESVQEFGQTTVMVTHDAHAAAIADRVLFLGDGLIVKELGKCDAHTILETIEEVSGR